VSGVITVEASGLLIAWTVEQGGGELRLLLHPGGVAVFDAERLIPISVDGAYENTGFVDGDAAVFDLASGHRLRLLVGRKLGVIPLIGLELQVYARRALGLGWRWLFSVRRSVEVVA